jgi:DNA-binding GntR family transcriptional regulator
MQDPDICTAIATKTRDLITRGVLAPGVHLGQMELAEQFKASTPPVREALRLLAGEGVIEHDPNRGFFVSKVSSDEARQLYRIRHLIEADVLATVDWPNKRQLADLKQMLVELERHHKDRKRDLWTARVLSKNI